MSDLLIAAIIATIPPTLTVLVKLMSVEKKLNGRFDQLREDAKQLAVESAVAAYARGVKDEQERHL